MELLVKGAVMPDIHFAVGLMPAKIGKWQAKQIWLGEALADRREVVMNNDGRGYSSREDALLAAMYPVDVDLNRYFRCLAECAAFPACIKLASTLLRLAELIG